MFVTKAKVLRIRKGIFEVGFDLSIVVVVWWYSTRVLVLVVISSDTSII